MGAVVMTEEERLSKIIRERTERLKPYERKLISNVFEKDPLLLLDMIETIKHAKEKSMGEEVVVDKLLKGLVELLKSGMESPNYFFIGANIAIEEGVLNRYLSDSKLLKKILGTANNIRHSRFAGKGNYNGVSFIEGAVVAIKYEIIDRYLELARKKFYIIPLKLLQIPRVIGYLKNTKDPLDLILEKIIVGERLGYLHGMKKDGIDTLDFIISDLERRTGLHLKSYGRKESLNLAFSYMYLKNLGYEDKLLSTFRKLTEVLKDYWNDQRIGKIISYLKDEGIQIEVLKDSILKVWDYRGKDIHNISYVDAVRALFFSLIGSKNPDNVKWGYDLMLSLVGKEIKSAREFYRSLPKSIKPKPVELAELIKAGRYEEFLSNLERSLGKYINTYGVGGRRNVIKSILNIINAVRSLKYGRFFGGKYIVAFTGRFPALLFSWSSTGACTHLPAIDDLVPRYLCGYASIKYLLDPRVVCIGLAITNDTSLGVIRERKGKLDGIIIGYIARDSKGNKVYMIDSVEMGSSLYFPWKSRWFNRNWKEIFDLILSYANRLNVDYVLFNNGYVLGNASGYFVQNLRELGLCRVTEELNVIGPLEIPYDNYEKGRHFLDAFKDLETSSEWVIPKGKVRGYKALV